MIKRAIIEKRIDAYHFKVRIPSLNKATSSNYATSTDSLATATVCQVPGINPVYDSGDVVFVGYEDDLFTKPIILGLLYRENVNMGEIDITSQSLTVDINCSLPIETTIGETKMTDIQNLKNTTGNIQAQIDLINSKIANI